MKFSKSMFDRLAGNVKKMGAIPQVLDLPERYPSRAEIEIEPPETDIEIELGELDSELESKLGETGIEIKLDELEETEGLLIYKGRPVVLFIPDHSFRIEKVIENPASGNKFHIADCEKLKEMRERKRYERYKVINNPSGTFPIYGTGQHSRKPIKRTVKLNVCKLCLKMLNYEGAATCRIRMRNEIVRRFSLEKFFSIYSSEFESLPKQHIEHAQKGYTDDWSDISKRIRCESGYKCEHCSVDLTNKKGLLHVHHINGDKADNSPENLKVLCADCHRKEHVHMGIPLEGMRLINDCRAKQGILDNIDTWEDVKKCADPALGGLIDLCEETSEFIPLTDRRAQQKIVDNIDNWEVVEKYSNPALRESIDSREKTNESIPRVHYKVYDDHQKVIAILELAWPDEKKGVYIGDKPELPDWTLLSLQEAIEEYRGKWEE